MVKSKKPSDAPWAALLALSAGSMQVEWGGRPWMSVDADSRNVAIEVGPLLQHVRGGRSILREEHLDLWQARGVPTALARAGWQVSLRDGRQELALLGREASPLTGHVRVHPVGLAKMLLRPRQA